jgi:hypothetical protein
VFTMHLRGAEREDKYHLTARLYYPDLEAVDHTELDFTMPATSAENDAPPTNQ